MKKYRFLAVLLGFLLLAVGCTRTQPPLRPSYLPTLPSTTATTVAPVPTESPEEKALREASEALEKFLPEGFALSIAQNEEHRLTRELRAEGGGKLLLSTLPADGSATAEQLCPPILSDTVLMENASALARAGVTVDLTRTEMPGDTRDMLTLMVGVIEGTGYTIDASEVATKVTDEAVRKALEMGLEEYIPYNIPEWMTGSVDPTEFDSVVTKTASALESRVLLRAGMTSTMNDVADLWPLLTGSDENPFTKSNTALTRRLLARAFYRVYTRKYPSASVSADYVLDATDVDADDENIVKLLTCNFAMNSFPDSSTFSPELAVRIGDLPGLLNTFAEALKDHPVDTESTDDSNEYPLVPPPAPTPVSYREMIDRAAAMLYRYTAAPLPEAEKKEVINLPSYSIYVNQRDGTPYDYVNCMPSITCMAIKWYDPAATVTPDELRQKYSSTSGWFMYMVEEQLDAYEVPYRITGVETDEIIQALDEGNIILAQFSTWNVTESGHCFVIVGYRRINGAMWYCVEDPEGNDEGIYDRPRNDRNWIEAEEALWSIKRFSSQLVIIMTPENAAKARAAAVG